MWIVEQRDPAGEWFVRATVDEQQDAQYYARLYKMHQAGAFFVTRAKRGMNARRVYSAQVDRATGVICDQSIAMNGFYVCKDYPEQLRRIRFKDPETGKTLVFLTNNTSLPALTIAGAKRLARYKSPIVLTWKFRFRIDGSISRNVPNAPPTALWTITSICRTRCNSFRSCNARTRISR